MWQQSCGLYPGCKTTQGTNIARKMGKGGGGLEWEDRDSRQMKMIFSAHKPQNADSGTVGEKNDY